MRRANRVVRAIAVFLVAIIVSTPALIYAQQASVGGGFIEYIPPPASSGVSGSGTNGQVTLWGASGVTGDTGFTYSGAGATFVLTTTGTSPAIYANKPAGQNYTGWGRNASTGGMQFFSGDSSSTPTDVGAGAHLVNSTFSLRAAGVFAFSSTSNPAATADTGLSRIAADAIACGNGTAADATCDLRVQRLRVGGTAPTCSSNCGTSPSVVGSDSAGIVTMGGTGSPASGWVITFAGTWAAAPSCTVQMALTGMANTKLPLTVVTTTTTITVVTNGAAPANSDKYAYHCVGVQ